jgi:RNA polymerase sigma factor (sigma-70 family)
MRKMTNGTKNDYELDDVFHDSILILYEKIIKGNFELTASLQVYLNSVCRFQLLNKIGKDKKYSDYDEPIGSEGDDGNPMGFISTITDVLDELEDTKESKLTAIESALEKMKDAGGHCYELLTLYWYHKKSHIEIAQIMNYSNYKTSKKQKSGCQEKLRKLTFNELNN